MDANASGLSTQTLQEAEQWLARLQAGNCPAGVLAAFEQWRAADPRHASAYDTSRRLLGRVGDLADDPAIAAALREARVPVNAPHIASARRATPAGRWALAASLAAGVAAISAAGILIYQTLSTPAGYQTAVGEQREVRLDDGSAVMLDTATSIRIEFDAGQRLVHLDRGRARFDVATENSRPFVVAAGANAITALGTVFDVRRDGEHIVVTLLEGRVRVGHSPPPSAQLTLPAAQELAVGERLEIAARGATERQAIDLDAAAGWTRGNLIFSSAPLSEVLTEINRYTPWTIAIGDPALVDLPVSGVFHVGDLQAVVPALQRSFPIEALTAPDGSTRLHLRK